MRDYARRVRLSRDSLYFLNSSSRVTVSVDRRPQKFVPFTSYVYSALLLLSWYRSSCFHRCFPTAFVNLPTHVANSSMNCAPPITDTKKSSRNFVIQCQFSGTTVHEICREFSRKFRILRLYSSRRISLALVELVTVFSTLVKKAPSSLVRFTFTSLSPKRIRLQDRLVPMGHDARLESREYCVLRWSSAMNGGAAWARKS